MQESNREDRSQTAHMVRFIDKEKQWKIIRKLQIDK